MAAVAGWADGDSAGALAGSVRGRGAGRGAGDGESSRTGWGMWLCCEIGFVIESREDACRAICDFEVERLGRC